MVRDTDIEIEDRDLYGAEFYHITPTSRLSQIKKEGLKPGSGETVKGIGGNIVYKGRLYLALFPSDLRDFPELLNTKMTLLKIKRLPKGTTLYNDPEGRGFYYTKSRIPASLIEVVRG